MRLSHADLDRLLGMDVYISSTPGIGGRIRERLEDFIVEEITKDRVRVPTSLTSNEVPDFGESKEGPYTWFVLEKRNLDTISAIRILASEFGVSHKIFSVAGLKDSKAVTAQLVSVLGIEPEKLIKYRDKYGNIIIRKAFKMPFKLAPGMLYGNHFIITIRAIELDKEEIKDRVAMITRELLEKGVPAYYGYQRFGTIRPNTHIIGKLILQGKFEDAVMELLCHAYPYEAPHMIELRKFVAETKDFRTAYEKFPRSMSHERTILKHLARRPNDFIGALRKLPMYVRRLFVSAYQSYLFNKCLSERIKRGLPINKAVVGDYVAIKLSDGSIGSIMVVNESNIDYINQKIKEGRMCLVLNVFGYKTILSQGEQGEIERKVLAEEGISLELFKSKHMPELATSGTYRIASFIPENLKIYGPNEDELNEGCYKITLEFTLGKGLYATTLLREYMKPIDIIKAGF